MSNIRKTTAIIKLLILFFIVAGAILISSGCKKLPKIGETHLQNVTVDAKVVDLTINNASSATSNPTTTVDNPVNTTLTNNPTTNNTNTSSNDNQNSLTDSSTTTNTSTNENTNTADSYNPGDSYNIDNSYNTK